MAVMWSPRWRARIAFDRACACAGVRLAAGAGDACMDVCDVAAYASDVAIGSASIAGAIPPASASAPVKPLIGVARFVRFRMWPGNQQEQDQPNRREMRW